MGRYWVKAIKGVIRHDLLGAYRTYQPGDWFECRNQELLELLARKLVDTTAHIIRSEFDGKDSGVFAVGNATPPDGLDCFGIEVKRGLVPELPWKRTLIMSAGASTTIESIALGLMRIDTEDDFPGWEMAAMLASETQLARDVGSPKDKERTVELVGGLDVPIYDSRLVWVRRTPATQEVIELWCKELATGADPRHAFIRAIYCQSVKLCTLPAEWIGRWIRA